MEKTTIIEREGELKFKPQLSGLRFLSLFFMILYHYSTFLIGVNKHYYLGGFIIFFFVLSSYLITRILLIAKQKAGDRQFSRRKVAVNFLFRRMLRIFPAYYFYLLIVILVPVAGQVVRQHPVIYFTYLGNVWIFITQAWEPYTAHLWTLAVEEQFYIFWPWIILFIPVKHLPKVFISLICFGMGFRILYFTFHPQGGYFPLLVLTPACIDCFAAGALLGYYHQLGKINNRWLKWVLLAAVPIWLYLGINKHFRIFAGLDRVFISLLSITLIDKANRGFTGLSKKILENRVIQYLSKISYGIYIYHIIVSYFFWIFYRWMQTNMIHLGLDLSFLGKWLGSPFVSFWIYLLLAIGLASISWFCLERPILRLNRLFEYVKPKSRKKPL